MSGVRSGVNGTPTFVNDFRHNGSYDYDVLEETINVAMGAKKTDAMKPLASRPIKQTHHRVSKS
jgi:predicted DsbA family dithiol-disulfide isomerase